MGKNDIKINCFFDENSEDFETIIFDILEEYMNENYINC